MAGRPGSLPGRRSGGGAGPARGDDLKIWAPTQQPCARKTVEDLLLAQGVIDADRLGQARTVQQSARGKKIAQILLEMGAATEDDVQQAMATILNLPFETVNPKALDRRAYDLLPQDFMKSRGCMGLHLDENRRLTLGMVDPADVFLLDEVKRKTNVKSVKPVVVCQHGINAAIEAANAGNESGDKFDEIIKEMGDEEIEIVAEEKEDVTDLAKASGESPGHPPGQLPDLRRGQAGRQRHPHRAPRKAAGGPLPHRRRALRGHEPALPDARGGASPPQDHGQPRHLRTPPAAGWPHPHDGPRPARRPARLARVPTQYGEKTVIRILDNRSIMLGLEQLGFSEDMPDDPAASRSTGPTASSW